eukprot:GILJ01004372.1.p1 GENE.GILJ01004372.1~~GILJ01004372.1.p1  ORF type:complete len:508 (+),score=48.62 GILJ01004372.1:154-1677(+)
MGNSASVRITVDENPLIGYQLGVVPRVTCDHCHELLGVEEHATSTVCPNCQRTVIDNTRSNFSIPSMNHIWILPFRETLPVEKEEVDPEFQKHLFEQYFLPYFAEKSRVLRRGETFSYHSVDFKVIGAQPEKGRIDVNTFIHSLGKTMSMAATVSRVHILPILRHTNIAAPQPNVIVERYLKPYFLEREKHLHQDEVFRVGDMEFKVVASEPENGVVSPSATTVYCNGDPIQIIKKIHVLPFKETLPSRVRRHLSEKILFENFLSPYFLGLDRLVHDGQLFTIEDTKFQVVSCQPERGIVTIGTELFASGDPLSLSEFEEHERMRQLARDEAIARELQQREGGFFMPPPMFGGMMHPPTPFMMSLNGLFTRARLEELDRSLPPQDPRHRVIRSYLDRMAPHPNAQLPFELIIEFAERMGQPDRGASEDLISQLPTRTFRPPTRPVSELSPEQQQCMICLSEFEEGKEIRTLPCLHFFDCECIDQWLRTNKTCPICKTAVDMRAPSFS